MASITSSPQRELPPLYEIKNTPKLYISNMVYEQIKTLCSEISQVEWSGVLFHTSKGFIDKPETFELRAEYILPMNMGTSGFTAYDFDENYTDALMDKPELLNYSISHVHSHNIMSVFFSGTDNEELQENAPNYDYYLSLIVNNNMDMVARVAFTGKVKPREFTFKGKNGKVKKIVSPEEDVIFYYNLDIVVEYPEILDEFFLKHTERIQKPVSRAVNTQHQVAQQGHLNLQTSGRPHNTSMSNETNAINFIKYCIRKFYGKFLLTTKETDSLYMHFQEIEDAFKAYKNFEKLDEAADKLEESLISPSLRPELYQEYLNRGIVFKDRISTLPEMIEEGYKILSESTAYAAFNLTFTLSSSFAEVLEEFIDDQIASMRGY
jgi:hypothetical protein